MMTLRCTRKLLEALREPPAAEPAPTSTVLGDWYANLYETRPRRIVLCLSERSLLAVMVEFGDASRLVDAIEQSVADLLARIVVPENSISAERTAMAKVRWGTTANRRVLGCLNEAAFALSHEFDAMDPRYFRDHEDYLSRFIYSTTGYQPPHELARELFQAACPGSRPNIALIH
jgi:hypothetical protein